MAKAKNLLQLAYDLKAGNRKLEDFPKDQRNRVRAMADSMTKEQLSFYAKPQAREVFNRFTSEHTRKARTA